MHKPAFVVLSYLILCSVLHAEPLSLKKGDHISYIGNTTADRMQHHGWLETYIHALYPEHDFMFRNLAFPGDELKLRPREDNFGSPDQWLAKNKTDVIFAFFGYNEAFRGPGGIPQFKKDLSDVIDGMKSQKYNGKSSPQIVMFSPIAHEDLDSRHLPDGLENNANLKLYTAAMKEVCESKDVTFVDLFGPTMELYKHSEKPLTMNGVHLLDHGNKIVAETIIPKLFNQAAPDAESTKVQNIRSAVLEKNDYWFNRYRVVDGYNVFGGRSKLSWFGQSNADVMKREMEIFDIMTANRDERIWALAKGSELDVKDDNIPEQLVVKSNRHGDLADGSFSYRTAEESRKLLKMADGLEANVFASEEMFPELINPVQMAVDPDGRLFVSVWPSYPHWNPTEPRLDRILMLPDDDQDGVADRCVVFADGLNSVTGFEFWNGGVLVAALPELWYLKDTDGDDKADLKIRMLQGLSSADSHHSANAMVLGPDGWIYWSRGIFNVATMETPTKTYRSTQSGVHRFNPRTFEMEFHFPIGPNPHGDVFDKWGYQFANDGTSGTGSYVNIGKGRGNKQWFKKRVRPVAATGILSSSHFPEAMQNNFLICNCIGYLGVLQLEVKYNGADIQADEIESIFVSSDPNFRPTDVEIGADGALYVSDWANALIGHMQHNMRDPNRDHQHGRIYRVTAKGRDLLKPVKLKGKPIPEVLDAFYAKENATRYRARIELSSRPSEAIVKAIAQWSQDKDSSNPDDAQALLECLWVMEEHRWPHIDFLKRVFQAKEPRVRAASIRTLGHWAGNVEGWESLLLAAAKDESPLVRAEAIKSAVEFEGTTPAEVVFEAASHPLDAEIEALLKYAQGTVNLEAMIRESIANNRSLSPAARKYALAKVAPDLLLKLGNETDVYEALLSRSGVNATYRKTAIQELAKASNRSEIHELISWIQKAEQNSSASLPDLTQLLTKSTEKELQSGLKAISVLSSNTKSSVVRRAAYHSWISAGDAGGAWKHAVESRARLSDFLSSVGALRNHVSASELFDDIRALQFELPDHLKSDGDTVAKAGPAVSFEYYEPHPAQNVAIETLDQSKPKITGRANGFQLFVPGGRKDAFATRQTASIQIPANGEYTFYTQSDDGSRLYVDGKLVVNNDGLHGMSEKGGDVRLNSGLHILVVTYFDNGGGDGLKVSWKGPGFAKQVITPEVLRPAGSGNLRVLAVEAVKGWKGKESENIADFVKLVQSESLASPALHALATLPSDAVSAQVNAEQRSNILNVLLEEANAATPVEKQSQEFSNLLKLGNALAEKASTNRNVTLRTLAKLKASIPVKADPKIMALGREIYMRESHCVTCHQVHGQGLPNLYPPIDGTLWTNGNEDRLISLALDGMHGTIEVKGKRYSSPPVPPMTGFRQLLNDQEIAAVLTYVRNSWSNRSKPVDPGQVARIRAIDRGQQTFWYAPDLMKKYPLEDGRKPIESSTGGDVWIPKFVRKWTLKDLDASKVDATKRDFKTGQLYFTRLGCAQCHKLDSKGGNFGPDLAKLDKKKLTSAYILESILDPSKVIEKKYQMKVVATDDGKIITGMIVEDKADTLKLITDPLNPNKPTIIKKSEILDQSETATSIMPNGLVNWLNESQIYDVVAYVLAGGREEHELFHNK